MTVSLIFVPLDALICFNWATLVSRIDRKQVQKWLLTIVANETLLIKLQMQCSLNDRKIIKNTLAPEYFFIHSVNAWLIILDTKKPTLPANETS